MASLSPFPSLVKWTKVKRVDVKGSVPWKHNTKVSSHEDKHILSLSRLGKEGRLNLEIVPSGVKGNLNLRLKKNNPQNSDS